MNENTFIMECKKIGIDITKEMLDKLNIFYQELVSYEKVNLTSIKETEEVYLKHFYDSLCLIRAYDLSKKVKLCDFGTGAGFPGLVLKIVFNNLDLTLIESNKKKCDFLNYLSDKLSLDVKIVNERAEIYAKCNREVFDVITCRAVSPLYILVEIAIPMLKINGVFLPMKSKIEDELKEASRIIDKIGSKINNTIEYFLPIENSKRTILLIEKTTKTKETFPREYNKILKSA